MFFLPTKVNITEIKLNNLDHAGSISFSSTLKQNRNVSGKKNQGFGQQMGDECLRIYTSSVTMDHEFEDSNSQKATDKRL